MSSSAPAAPASGILEILQMPDHCVQITHAGNRCVSAGLKNRPSWMLADSVLTDHIMYFLLRGRHALVLNGALHPLNPGTFVWLQPGVRRAFRFLPGCQEFEQFYLRFGVLPRRPVRESRRAPALLLDRASTLEAPFRELIEAAALHFRRTDVLSGFRLRSRFQLLLSEIAEHAQPPASPGLSPRQRQMVLDCADARIRERPLPADLARSVGLSADYFSGLFRNTFGIPPRRWLVERRIAAAARQLIETHLPVSEVADHFGYADVFLFSRQFKSVLGRSPSTYRRRYG